MLDALARVATLPAAAIAVTLLVYVLALHLQERAGRHPLLNPVAVSVTVLIGLLGATAIPYRTYFDSVQAIHLLLGPATVALAVPLHANLRRARRLAVAMAGTLAVGWLTTMVAALTLASVLRVSPLTRLALGVKSVTTPIAMGIAQALGGEPALTAALVIVTGILGAVLGPAVLDLARVHDAAARGFAMGLASHGIGTARAFQESETAGAFAGLAMGLNGITTALLLPPLVRLLGAH